LRVGRTLTICLGSFLKHDNQTVKPDNHINQNSFTKNKSTIKSTINPNAVADFSPCHAVAEQPTTTQGQ
jgi:hypothetical protein